MDGDGSAATGEIAPLDVVADELYRLPLEEFVPARDARAKAARGEDRALAGAIGKLRKPSSAAWVVNLLVHERPELLEQLADLADALRAAQESLSGDQIRGLSAQRHQVVASVVRESRRLATARGVKVGDAVQRELEATFDAALADPAAATAVRSGRLTTALSYAGLGDLGSSPEAVAAPASAPPAAPPERPEPSRKRTTDAAARARAAEEAEAQRRAEAERRRQEHEQALREAESSLAAAVEARDEADAARDQVRVDHEDAQQQVEELQQQLEQAQQHLSELAVQERDSEKAAARAGRATEAAERRVAAARRALDRLDE